MCGGGGGAWIEAFTIEGNMVWGVHSRASTSAMTHNKPGCKALSTFCPFTSNPRPAPLRVVSRLAGDFSNTITCEHIRRFKSISNGNLNSNGQGLPSGKLQSPMAGQGGWSTGPGGPRILVPCHDGGQSRVYQLLGIPRRDNV
jgi:hypothetical protein